MKCPYCSSIETKVVDKRELEESVVTRRRRECLQCAKRFTTYERADPLDFIILKKDGSKENFDREKLGIGIKKACEKLPIGCEKIEDMIDSIEHMLKNMDCTEIQSNVIGEYVMAMLKKEDEVAYLRFASVYRNFKDAEEFVSEFKKMKD
ncbi:MAG: transcriptional repressor NrdR [Nanoarchaeota archaeon]|nr:transcriptional repressor NrdR [Nanoarchaeota archaeon]MCK5629979.1 transcriptional repressor NrdR [Nanoarchaeota archaeon]